MLKQLQMGLRAFLVLASKIWTFVCFVFRKKAREVTIYAIYYYFNEDDLFKRTACSHCLKNKIAQTLNLLFAGHSASDCQI